MQIKLHDFDFFSRDSSPSRPTTRAHRMTVATGTMQPHRVHRTGLDFVGGGSVRRSDVGTHLILPRVGGGSVRRSDVGTIGGRSPLQPPPAFTRWIL